MAAPSAGVLSPAERTRRVATVLWVTLALNWTTAILKIAFGWLTNTMVIVADGFHSLSDGTSNVIGLVGIYMAGHPADEDHPYGHHKYETLASTFIGAMLLVVAYGILQNAVLGFFHPREPRVTPLSFGVMALTLVVNLFVVLYERNEAKKLKSDLLLSDSWHTLTDVFVTLGVFTALGGILLNLRLIDSIFSLGIGGLIAVIGVRILHQSADVLMDHAVLDPKKVDAVVTLVPGVQGCHEIRTRGNSHRIYVDLHVLVDPRMSVEESHRMANEIEMTIKRDIEGVWDVVVHVEPTTHDHSGLKAH